MNKNSILKNAQYYQNMSEEWGVSFYDLSDFTFENKTLRNLFKKVYNFSNNDKINLKEPYLYYVKKNKLWMLQLSLYILRKHSFKEILKTSFQILLKSFSKIIIKIFFSFEKVIKKLNCSSILLDNRESKDFLGSKSLINYLAKSQIPVFLVPHGAHYRTPIGEYCKFLPWQDELPQNFIHWIPFKEGTPWKASKTPRNQFIYTGYPGFDDSWLRYLKSRAILTLKSVSKINILYIIRRYVDKNDPIFKNLDYYILDKEDVFNPLIALTNWARKNDLKVSITVKPHPKNPIEQLNHDLTLVGLDEIKITNEPIYGTLNNIDFVISIHSTILFVPILYGIPTIVLNGTLHKKVINRWPVLKNLYNNLSFFVENHDDLENAFSYAINGIKNKHIIEKDIEHVYNYFDNNSAQIALNSIDFLNGYKKENI